MRTVRYAQTEFRHPGKEVETDLFSFLYDLPYVFIYGVFPPLPVLNEVLMMGGVGGGMSPGAEWEPFSISQSEYRELMECAHSKPDPDKQARFFNGSHFTFESGYDGFDTWDAWFSALSEKYA